MYLSTAGKMKQNYLQLRSWREIQLTIQNYNLFPVPPFPLKNCLNFGITFNRAFRNTVETGKRYVGERSSELKLFAVNLFIVSVRLKIMSTSYFAKVFEQFCKSLCYFE